MDNAAIRLPARVIEHTGRQTKQHQVADAIRKAIADGIYRPGQQLPTINELTSHYNVSRLTVRDAFKILRNEGLVTSGRGTGTFVRKAPPIVRWATGRLHRSYREQGLGPYSVDAKYAGITPHVDAVQVSVVTFDEDLASKVDHLASDWVGTQVVQRSRTYLVGGQSLQWSVSYIPLALAEGTSIMNRDTGDGGIYARLEEAGHLIARFQETVQARLPLIDEMDKIAVGSSQPIIRTIRKAFSAEPNERVLEICDSVMSADSYRLVYDIPG
ncbi:GntR family transcriptional regulator [Mycolicibacterium goodii]|uniref:GntR family transcriptional regulator n=1 Tax=Mycolicibacterium goodii TaxID=134601 RepID=UPI001BDBFF0B|nr:GntR family transcriptional regulator [Mycolicibacterium goodii]MBU8820478.1 GntR family transcriptional regulator [Mycolicibacterium goodii]